MHHRFYHFMARHRGHHGFGHFGRGFMEGGMGGRGFGMGRKLASADLQLLILKLLDEKSRSDTYPTMEVDEKEVTIEHEATVSKVGEEQLFYLMSRGLTQDEATAMIVNGFFEPFTKELPLEYAVELNRLIQLEMEGSVG